MRISDVIENHCSLVEPSFTNYSVEVYKYEESEILCIYSFFPNENYRHKISEKPNEIHYVPLRKDLRQIIDFIVTIQDEKCRH